MARKKHKSRASRCNDACQILWAIHSEIEELVDRREDEFNDKEFTTALEEQLSGIDSPLSEVESCMEEIENWKCNLEGTNLEYSSKYEELEECYNQLEEATSALRIVEGMGIDDIDEIISELDSQLSEIEGVAFPGAFGR